MLSITTSGTDVSGATLNIGATTGVDVVALGTNAATLTAEQHALLIAISATNAITGTGIVTLDTPATDIVADDTVASYVLTGAGANTITLGATTQGVTTAANASTQTINTGALT